MTHYYRFRVQLRGIKPPIWRRFLLPESASFADLHLAIQDCCGWTGGLGYTFQEPEANGAFLSVATSEAGDDLWDEKPLTSWFKAGDGTRPGIVYLHDFGDEWQHDVELEAVEEHAADHGRRLLNGARAFPHPNCGGVSGYKLCTSLSGDEAASVAGDVVGEAVGDDFARWLRDWDPEAFDVELDRRFFERAPASQAAASKPVTGEWVDDHTAQDISLPGESIGNGSQAERLAQQLARIIKAASVHEPCLNVTTGLPCTRRPERRQCKGTVDVSRAGHFSDIVWSCSVCSDSGIITEWTGGPQDLRRADATAVLQLLPSFELRIPAEVYRALLTRADQLESDLVLFSATASAGQVVLRGIAPQFQELYLDCRATAAAEFVGALRTRLETACAMMESVPELELSASVDSASPTLALTGESAGQDLDRALVLRATDGLALNIDELEELQALASQARQMFAGDEADVDSLLLATLRETGESILLERQMREVLAVGDVAEQDAPAFLQALENTLNNVLGLAATSPASAYEALREFLHGFGEIAAGVQASEGELAAFAKKLASVAWAQTGRHGSVKVSPQPVLLDLASLWLVDDCRAFHFVPEFLTGLRLNKHVRAQFREELEELEDQLQLPGKLRLAELTKRMK